VDVCPPGALQLKNQHIELTKARCESCGLCLNVCPADAITFPGHSAAELDAELAALLAPALADLAPRGILFVCRQSAPALAASVERGARYPAGWLPISVPCAGSLSPAVWLRCLALGAAGVGIAACRDQCTFHQGDVVAERVAFCQEVLRQLGAPPALVRLCPVTGDDRSAWALPEPVAERPAVAAAGAAASGPRAAAAALVHLATMYAAPSEVRLDHAQSSFGIVELDAQGCTACQACTDICPTGALAASRERNAVVLSFDAALCTACGLCAPRCPERERGVLRLHRAVDLRRLAAGRTTLVRDQTPRCVVCGAAVAPAAMLTRVAALLGDEAADLMARNARYCPDCRGLAPRR
jgi:Pyruvate/2-oxoacid:ferredoxin oxidoreductase delta subunit/coenzyme F420-reducing hydrogenase delta subunit